MLYQISILRELIYSAVDHGADFHELCRRLEVTPEQLSNGEGMIRWYPDPAREFWSIAVEMTGDPLLGLRLGQHETPRGHFGMLEMLAKTCRTLGDAIRAVCRYNDTLTQVFKYSCEIQGEHAVVLVEPLRLWELHNEDSARQAVDTSLSGFVKSIYLFTDEKVTPTKIEIKYGPRSPEEYERILRAPVVFNASRNALILHRADLNAPLIAYDQSLYAVFDALLRQKQSMMTERTTLTQRIRQLLLQEFRGQIPSIEIIASHVSMTPRTLQRKLAGEQTSFREISLRLRKELAEELLSTGGARKHRVAAMLGYADTDSLRRALKGSEAI
jgi:AraC-like DNA-binding protein